MQRSVAWAIAMPAVALLAVSFAGYRVHAADRRALDELRGRLAELDARRSEPPADNGGFEARVAELELSQTDLLARLQRFESGLSRTPVAAREEAPPVDAAPAAEAAAAPAAVAAKRRELEELLGRLVRANWDFSGSGGDLERFLELARESGLLDERIAELEAVVAAAPGDVEARMELADHYVGRLMLASGPEQGLWGGRAEEQWQAVAELDDGHWRAHSQLGTNYSYYPSVMGKTDDAIRHLERALQIQRAAAASQEHVQTYLYLSRLYLRSAKRDEARALLEEGLRRHPGDARLEEALAELQG